MGGQSNVYAYKVSCLFYLLRLSMRDGRVVQRVQKTDDVVIEGPLI